MPTLALDRRLRLGIVGLGRMGMRHWHTWTRLENIDLVAICDPDPVVQCWSRAQGLQTFSRVGQLLGMIDIAVVASPSSTHSECALTLLQHGIACLVEKPLALSSEDCVQLALCAEPSNTLLTVGQCERFNPGVLRALSQINRSTATLEVFRHASHAAPADSDVIVDLLVHDLDWVLLCGQRLSVARVLESTQVDGRLQAIKCRLDFANGLQVVLSASYNVARRREVILSSHAAVSAVISLEWQLDPERADPLTLQAEAFVQALQGGASRIARAADAQQVMQICELLRQQVLPTPACREPDFV